MDQSVDLNQLAAQAVAALAVAAPLGEGILKGIGGEIGKAGVQGAVRVWQAVYSRFAADGNKKGQAVLALFQEDPKDEDQASALGKQILAALAADPQWAAEIRALVHEQATQEIVARNNSFVRDIQMRMAGGGQQRIEADGGSTVERVSMGISTGDEWTAGEERAMPRPAQAPAASDPPVKLRGEQVQQIQDAIVAGYTPDTLRAMVRTRLDENLDSIAQGNTLRAQVFALIEWAEREGRVAELLQSAHAANPSNAGLQQLWAEFQVK